MKKLISLILTLAITLTIVTTITLPVKALTYNGFVYEIINGEVKITRYTGSATFLTIPEKISGYPVTTIGGNVFYGCGSLTSVTIPNSVAFIGEDAFASYSLTNITVSEDNTNFSSLDGVLYNKNKTELIQYPPEKSDKSFTIPSSVTSIGNGAFYLSNFTSITIPSSVTNIGESAFIRCRLSNVTIPNSVTAIGDHAFFDSDSLTNVTIPSSVTIIGDKAFDGCDLLKSITVSEDNANYSSLGGVLYNKNKTELIKYPPEKSDKSFTIPSSVTAIGDYAFFDSESLTNVTIPSSVTNIGEDAFDYCDLLKSITVSEDNANYSSLDGVLYNKNKTELIKYSQGKEDTTFTIPSGVTIIGDKAFYSCDLLKSVTIPNSVAFIGKNSFYGCDYLETANYIGDKSQFSKIEGYGELANFTINYIVTLSLNGEEKLIEYNSSNKPILSLGYTDSLNKHFAILGWKDKNGNEVDTSTLTADNMIPLTAVTTEIPVAPALLEANLIPNKDPYLPKGNKYTNGFFVQGTQIRVPAFDDSVKMGLRFVNILDNNLLTGLKDGATDVSYGTLVMLKKDHDGGEVTFETKNATKVEGKKTFKHASEFNNQYLKFTVCVTGIKEENFTENIIVRPYITFTYNGNVVTLYGEQYENASLYSAAKLAVAEGSTENPSVQTWLQANIIDIVEQTGDNEFEL